MKASFRRWLGVFLLLSALPGVSARAQRRVVVRRGSEVRVPSLVAIQERAPHKILPARRPRGRRRSTLPTSSQIELAGYLQVDRLSPSIQAQSSGRPGLYPIETPLRLRVASPVPGWRMTVESTGLNSEGESEIGAGEIHLVVEGSDTLPLSPAQTVVEEGLPGETIVEIHLALKTTDFHEPGLYQGHLLVGTQLPGDSDLALMEVPLEVRVVCQIDHTIEGNKMFFHVGNPAAAEGLSAVMTGRVMADAVVRLNLSVAEGRIDQLPQVKLFPPAGDVPENSIPLAWMLGEDSSLRAPDSRSPDGSGVSWLLQGTPGEVQYRLECTVKPEAYQAPGDYGTAVVIALEPLL